MFLDDVDDALIKLVFQSEIDPFFHVRDDDQRAHGRRQVVVRVAFEIHVLGKVFWLHQLADVVKIGADAAKSRIRADRFRSRFGQVRHYQAVMICAGGFDCHAAEQRMIEIGGFQPGNISGDLKELLEHRQRAPNHHGGNNPVANGQPALQADESPIVRHRREEIDWADEPECERQQPNRHRRHQARPE